MSGTLRDLSRWPLETGAGLPCRTFPSHPLSQRRGLTDRQTV